MKALQTVSALSLTAFGLFASPEAAQAYVGTTCSSAALQAKLAVVAPSDACVKGGADFTVAFSDAAGAKEFCAKLMPGAPGSTNSVAATLFARTVLQLTDLESKESGTLTLTERPLPRWCSRAGCDEQIGVLLTGKLEIQGQSLVLSCQQL